MECVILVELVSVLGEVLVFELREEKTQLSRWSFLIHKRRQYGEAQDYEIRQQGLTSIYSEMIIYSERS